MRAEQLAEHEGCVDLAKRRVIATRLNVGLLQGAGQRLDRGRVDNVLPLVHGSIAEIDARIGSNLREQRVFNRDDERAPGISKRGPQLAHPRPPPFTTTSTPTPPTPQCQ